MTTTKWQPVEVLRHRETVTSRQHEPVSTTDLRSSVTIGILSPDGKTGHLVAIRDQAIAIGMADTSPLPAESLELIARLVSAQRAARVGLAS